MEVVVLLGQEEDGQVLEEDQIKEVVVIKHIKETWIYRPMININLIGEEVLINVTDNATNDVETYENRGVIVGCYKLSSFLMFLIYEYKEKRLYERRAIRCKFLKHPYNLSAKKLKLKKNDILDLEE